MLLMFACLFQPPALIPDQLDPDCAPLVLPWSDAYDVGHRTGTPIVAFNRCRALPMHSAVIVSEPNRMGPAWRRGVLVARWLNGRWRVVWLSPAATDAQINGAITTIQSPEPPVAR